jgi:hypothetical protein
MSRNRKLAAAAVALLALLVLAGGALGVGRSLRLSRAMEAKTKLLALAAAVESFSKAFNRWPRSLAELQQNESNILFVWGAPADALATRFEFTPHDPAPGRGTIRSRQAGAQGMEVVIQFPNTPAKRPGE